MKFIVCHFPGRDHDWPMTFPTRELAEKFMQENGIADHMHVVEEVPEEVSGS